VGLKSLEQMARATFASLVGDLLIGYLEKDLWVYQKSARLTTPEVHLAMAHASKGDRLPAMYALSM